MQNFLSDVQVDVFGSLKPGTIAQLWLWNSTQSLESSRFELTEEHVDVILSSFLKAVTVLINKKPRVCYTLKTQL